MIAKWRALGTSKEVKRERESTSGLEGGATVVRKRS